MHSKANLFEHAFAGSLTLLLNHLFSLQGKLSWHAANTAQRGVTWQVNTIKNFTLKLLS